MGKELLDLSTIVERETVRITSKTHPAGKLYEIRSEHELSFYDLAMVEAKNKVISEIDLTKKPTPAKEREYRKALRDLTAIVAPTIEPKVLTDLSDISLLAIVGLFAVSTKAADEGNVKGGRQTSAA